MFENEILTVLGTLMSVPANSKLKSNLPNSVFKLYEMKNVQVTHFQLGLLCPLLSLVLTWKSVRFGINRLETRIKSIY